MDKEKGLRSNVPLGSEIDVLRQALYEITCELGVPQPGYPQPVANAYEIAMKALKRAA